MQKSKTQKSCETVPLTAHKYVFCQVAEKWQQFRSLYRNTTTKTKALILNVA